MKQHKTGFWYPENSGSTSAIKEAYYLDDYGGLPTIDFTGKTVMDCGAHIGTFARRAVEEGASRVVCYEPFPQSVECITLNVPSAEIVPCALVKGEETAVEFHVRPQRLEGGSIIHKGANHHRWGYQTIEVAAKPFWEEFERVKPDILKIDIEGAEWDIFDREIPSHVHALFIEVHGLYSKGTQHAIDWVNSIFPGRIKSIKELIPFKNKNRVTNVSLLVVR